MKTPIAFAVGLLFGAFAMLLALAWPEISPGDAISIQAFRDMGCEPYLTKDGALISGCKQIKHLTEVTR